MTDERFDISRRKALAALGTIGVASAGAGLGTSAYFSDQETFENNQLTAGTLDMKVAATEYYSDWSSDEAQYAGMASDDASTDIRLPAGSSQSDAQDIAIDIDGDNYENFFSTLETGETINGGISAATDDGLCDDTPEADADGRAIINIGDVKPGDFGGAQFAFELCDNPGYVWLNGRLVSKSENGVNEPEADDPDEDQVEGSGNPGLKTGESGDKTVELLDEIQVTYSVGPINDNPSGFGDTSSGFQPNEQYSLREFLNSIDDGPGSELSEGTMNAEQYGGTGEQGCFAGETVHQVSVVWWLPIDHGNQVQSDSVTFDLGFYTEQCRHNDGSGMNDEDVDDGSGSGPAFDVYSGDAGDELVAEFTVQSEDDGESLTGITLDHTGGTDISNTGSGDVDVELNGTNIDSDVDDVSGTNSGTTLDITLGGNNSLSTGDTVTVVYGDVQNRSDTTDVTGTINGDGSVTDSQPLVEE